MSHNQKRSDWKKEFVYAAIGGSCYGATVIAIGHPWDTVKTKMQTQSQHIKSGYIDTVLKVLKHEGPVGFYRGWVPPLIGSIIYRSV